MTKLHLNKNRKIVRLQPECYLIWKEGFHFTVQSIRLRSYTFENQPCMVVEFYVGEFDVAAFILTKDEFINIHTVFNPPTKDKLNVLEEAEVKTADTDQVPAAGTNNAAIV